MNKILDLLDSASKAQGGHVFYNPNGDVRAVHPGKPVVRSILNLNSDVMPFMQEKDGGLTRAPQAKLAVENSRLSVSLVDASRIAQAGATVVVMPDPSKAFAVDGVGEVTMTPRPARFLTIEAAPFAVVEDGADVGESALPLSRAAIDFSTAPQMAIRFRVSRRDQKDFQDQADAIMTAITLGLARAADATLLAAITAAIPAAFSLAAAAEKGLRFDELRALVGTAGAGAAVSQDGKLRVAGVAAELTADTAATFVGAFSRSAVAVHEAIDVVAERTSVAGDLVVTCWANMQALLPNAGMFFKVSA